MHCLQPCFFVTTALALLAAAAVAQRQIVEDEDYLEPPPAIRDILLADASRNVLLSAGRSRFRAAEPGTEGSLFLVPISGGLVPLSRLARPYVILAETSLDARAFRSRSLSVGSTQRYELLDVRTGKRLPIASPRDANVSAGRIAPDGSRVAFLVHRPVSTELWIAGAHGERARRLCTRAINATLVTRIAWTSDSSRILCVLVPAGRAPAPRPHKVANSPTVRVTSAGKTPQRTYRFLLETPEDAALLAYLTTGQLALVDATSGSIREIGAPALYRSASISPDGEYLRVTTMRRPFSYFVPAGRFATVDEILDLDGKRVALIKENPLRLARRARSGASQTAGDADDKRSLAWRPDGAGLSYLQLEPRKKDEKKKGDTSPATRKTRRRIEQDPATLPASRQAPRNTATSASKKRKDRVMQWFPPFTAESARVVWESDERISSVQYSEDCRTLFVTRTTKGRRQVFAVRLADPAKKVMISSHKTDDFYAAPGSLLTKAGKLGVSVVRMSRDAKSVWLGGTQYDEDPAKAAPRPFLDRVTLDGDDSSAAKRERIWQSDAQVYESIVRPMDDEMKELITTRQSPLDPPDNFVRNLETGGLRAITKNVDLAPTITACRRERFLVERCDGFKFWVRVTVPRDHGERLPALFWFYPREFTSQKAYDERQRTYNKNRFPRVSSRSAALFTELGYAVVEPDCPIVGAQGRMNDNYPADLRNSLWAVVDACDKRAFIDRDRLAIGGHSYGAFGTANALAHTPFFKAGIAGDGNYNRTLTPMSFQSERRHVWDARETYIRMSPLLWANQVQGALLMYHGLDDMNTGTFPIHSPRMFHALDGLGKRAALYMYPYEGHGPRARETILDLWARWVAWLDMHVKHPERAKELDAKAPPRRATEPIEKK